MRQGNEGVATILVRDPDDERITRLMKFATKNALVDIVCLKKEEDKLKQTRHVPYALKEKQDHDQLAQVRKDMRTADLVVVRKAKIT